MIHRENTADNNWETLLLDILLIQSYSGNRRAEDFDEKRKKRTHSVAFFASIHKYGERIALSDPPLLPLLDFVVQSHVLLCLHFLFVLGLWLIVVAQSGDGISIHVFVFSSKRYLFDSTSVSSALKLPLFSSFSSQKRGINLVIRVILFPTHLPESASFTLRQREKNHTCIFFFIHPSYEKRK